MYLPLNSVSKQVLTLITDLNIKFIGLYTILISLNWNWNREISKLNYRIHTDTIKENLIPPRINARTGSAWGTYLRKWLMYVACWRFSKSYDSILQGTFEYDMFYDNNHSLTVRLLKKAMSEFVFDSRVITEPEISAQIILDFLLDKFVPALVRFDDYGIMTAQDKKIITLLSSNYIDDYFKAKEVDSITNEAELLYRRILIATDFISGMTDGYAKMLYKRMSGLE